MTLSFSSQAAKITDDEILVCAFTNSLVSKAFAKTKDIKEEKSYSSTADYWGKLYVKNHGTEELKENGQKIWPKLIETYKNNKNDITSIIKECLSKMPETTNNSTASNITQQLTPKTSKQEKKYDYCFFPESSFIPESNKEIRKLDTCDPVKIKTYIDNLPANKQEMFVLLEFRNDHDLIDTTITPDKNYNGQMYPGEISSSSRHYKRKGKNIKTEISNGCYRNEEINENDNSISLNYLNIEGSCAEKDLQLYQIVARNPLTVYFKVHKDN